MAPNLSIHSKLNGNDDDIVITGMSGKFPSSRNIKEFEYNLYNKINMVTDDEQRWDHTDSRIPKFLGKIDDLNKFDSTFFGVHQIQAENMDPQNRILIEESFKAIMDAGVNPFDLRGSNTGVYVGSCISETEQQLYVNYNPTGFGLTGTSKAMLANRLSFIFGFVGPSLQCDTACSSSMYALNLAFQAMEMGIIDSALVAGSNLCLHPITTLEFSILGVLSPTENCRPFDNAANGYTRSETIGCIFLQRKSAAKRVYASLISSRTNCDGFKQEGITFPSRHTQEKLLRELYSSVNINMDDLGYFEAHSTGTVAGDPEECWAIDKAVCSKRNSTLLVGSVKSNCGHAEPSSGICSLVKVLLAFQNNLIAPNINFTTIRKSIDALSKKRLTVVTEPTPLQKPYIGVNSFGFGGANAHALLKRFDKEKVSEANSSHYTSRLVTWSSRTEQNALDFFTNLENQPLNEEYLALANNAQLGGIQGMVFRGFSILKSNGSETNPTLICKHVQHYQGIKPPIVWVFSGMGSQWAGMGKSLMTLPLFKKSIQRCQNTLKPSGIDLVNIISSDDPKIFDNILHSFVGIAAIQIGLVDVLRELELSPDIIIGHSVGELGCSYADNCFTAEQTILSAYYRGKVSLEMSNIKGSMAAIGLGYTDILPLLPETIEVACHNSSESCTISGPIEDVDKFVNELKSKNIFAKVVPSSNIAYHSKYISHFGPKLLKYLNHIIPTPKRRTKKWISSSIPKSKWGLEESNFASAEYHTNNLLNSVLFEEAATNLPKNALTVEIAPHGLLQSILKVVNPQGTHIALTKRNTDDSIGLLINSLGRIYCNGVELNINKLYSEIQWPVSRGTPSLSHLIEFDHSTDYKVYSYKNYESGSIKKVFTLDLSKSHRYLKGHEIDGRTLVPATFYLECVWKTFSNMNKVPQYENCPVEFRDVQFIRATTLVPNSSTQLTIVIHKGTGIFEITESQSVVATGIVVPNSSQTKPTVFPFHANKECVSLIKKDFYKELKLRGYHYNGDFQGVELSCGDGSYGKVKWINNWVPFMDCMLQLSIVGRDSRNLMLPTKLRILRIYPSYLKSALESAPDSILEVFANKIQKRITAAGIEIIGLEASAVQRRRTPGDPVLEKYQFISHFPSPKLSLDNAARCCIQLVLENQPRSCLNVIAISGNEKTPQFLLSLMKALGELPVITSNCTLEHKGEPPADEELKFPGITQVYGSEIDKNSTGNIVIASNVSGNDADLIGYISKKVETNGFVICKEDRSFKLDEFIAPQGFSTIAVYPTDKEVFVMLEQLENLSQLEELKFVDISSSDLEFKWMEDVKQSLNQEIVLVAQNDKFSGILGLTNCIRKEPDTSKVRCVLIDDPNAPPFNFETPLYAKQLKLGLAINVFRKGQWGTYRHLLLPSEYPLTTRSDHVFGNIMHIGDLSSLKWFQGPVSKEEAKVKILYSSLNFRDVMLASGRLPIEVFSENRLEQKCIFGFEYSGIDLSSGKLIMGMTAKGAVASFIGESASLCWEVPQHWSLRDAATVPVVYLTVYYAFFFTVDIRKGRSILIHAGSGGIGLAAIRVALAYGLDIFTTVSTADKRAFLLKTYPSLKESHIGNSRDTSFEEMIMDQTNGKGVDFVLNSLSEEKLVASIRCLGKGGKFLEIGKFDMANDNKIGLGHFLNEISFHAVLADNLLGANVELVEKIKSFVQNDIANGIIQPLPSTVFMAHEIEQAFRYLMSGKHIGKVIIQVHDDPVSEATMPISVIPQVYFSEKLVYIIPGGLGGFGLELVDWMALRGAKKFVLSSRRGISNDYQKLRIKLWNSYSCQIVINTSDIGTYDGCAQLIEDSIKLGAVGGIFNLAVLLRDALFSNQTVEHYRHSFAPKALATLYLDEISRKRCPDLQHFVIFSSVSCGRGNAGQTNYGMANSIMERIIENRIAHGLPGKAIQWGAVGEVGLVAEMAEGKIDLEIGGTLQQRISSCLQVLDVLMNSSDAIVSSMVVAEKRASSMGQSALEFVLNIMSIRDIKLISMSSSLADIGMDSLMAVEIKQVFERDYDIVLSSTDLRSLTLERLAELSGSHEKDVNVVPATEDNVPYINPEETLKLFNANLYIDNDPNIVFAHINDLEVGIPIIILTGIDGCCGPAWKNIGKKLKSPAYVLQLHIGSEISTIDDILKFGFKNISEFLQRQDIKYFQLVGYSLGAMVAHMLIPQLESNGYQGQLVLIDGSPIWIQHMVAILDAVFKDNGLFKNTIGIMLNLILPQTPYATFIAEMENIFIKHNILNYFHDTLEKYNFRQIDRACLIAASIYKKIQIIRDQETYQSISIINTPILLLKASIQSVPNVDEDFGLTAFSRSTIDIHTATGNHYTILENEVLPDLINDYFNFDQ